MSSEVSSLRTGEGVVIDIGTGDGLFAYRCAQENPNKFYIGIDASPGPLEKISEKIHRKPEKGGAPNALLERGTLSPSEWTTLRTSWAKRLRGEGGGRSVFYFIARSR